MAKSNDIGRRVASADHGDMSFRELVLIGIGGIVGAGYFLGAGSPIRTAGPSVLIAFLVGGFITAQTAGALITLSLDHAEEGSFQAYSARYLGTLMGYLQGWFYYLGSLLTISSEAVASAIFVRVWLPHLPLAVMSYTFAGIVILINVFGVKNFGIVESWMSVVKIAALVGFIVVAALLAFGWHAGPGHASTSTSALHTGFFATGVHGVLQSMLIVIFTFGGIGVFGTAAVRIKNPKRLDAGGMTTISLLTLLYLLSIGGLLLVMPWQTVSTKVSPFVQALQYSGLHVFADILNGVILVAAFSVMAGSVFSANQILVNLGRTGDAPRFVGHLSPQRQTAYGAMLFTALGVGIFIGMSYVLPSEVYQFLISASSFFTFFNWFIILATMLAWRRKTGKRRFSRLSFGHPVSTYVTMALIAFLAIYALTDYSQRMGFYACLAMAFLVVLGYVFGTRRHRPAKSGVERSD